MPCKLFVKSLLVLGCCVGGPASQGRAVVCRVGREQAGNVCDKRLPLLQAPLLSRASCGIRLTAELQPEPTLESQHEGQQVQGPGDCRQRSVGIRMARRAQPGLPSLGSGIAIGFQKAKSNP